MNFSLSANMSGFCSDSHNYEIIKVDYLCMTMSDN